MQSFVESIYESSIGTAVREGATLFPWIESVHVLAVCLVVGSIIVVDVRLLGFSAHRRGVHRLMLDLLPITWIAFVVSVITGLLLFSSNAIFYWESRTFWIKIGLILLAGVNMGVFHATVYKQIADWDTQLPPPVKAKIAGGISLAIWMLVLIFGRWIGFSAPFA